MKPNKLIFHQYEGFVIVGDNSTIYSNGIKDANYSGIVVIPQMYNGLPVLEIGCFAFSKCSFITHVLIEADLRAINAQAFSAMPSLQSINIPKTVTFMGECAITSFNIFNQSVDASVPNSMGTLIISLESGSQLNYIGKTPFGRKQNIILTTEDDLSHISCFDHWFYSADRFLIYSTKDFTSCGVKSVVVPFVDLLHDVNSIRSFLSTIARCPTLAYSFKITSNILFTVFILFV